MSLFVQAANTLAADVRSFVDDLGRGFMSGGIAGAVYVVLCRSRAVVLLIWIAVEVM